VAIATAAFDVGLFRVWWSTHTFHGLIPPNTALLVYSVTYLELVVSSLLFGLILGAVLGAIFGGVARLSGKGKFTLLNPAYWVGQVVGTFLILVIYRAELL
jgi:hypothetical protein